MNPSGQQERKGDYVLLTNSKYFELMARLFRAEEASRQNEVTGLPNRRALLEFWRENQRRLKREHFPLGKARMAVIYGDLSKFKEVNERYGESVGDRLLCEVGKILSAKTRPGEVVANPYGDSFIAVIFGGSRAARAVMTRFELGVRDRSISAVPKGGRDEEMVRTTLKLKHLETTAAANFEVIFKDIDRQFYEKPRGK